MQGREAAAGRTRPASAPARTRSAGALARTRTPTPGSRALSAWLLPLAAVAVALAVVAGAALAGPWRMAPLEPFPSPQVTPASSATPTPTPRPSQTPPAEQPEGDHQLPLTPIVAIGIAIALLVALLVLRHMRRGADGASDPGTGEPADDLEVEPSAGEGPNVPAVRRGVAAARAVLADHGDAGDAVIAAWLELEAAAASSGIARRPAQTPTEFTTAVLDATRADPEATRALLRLYLRARFAPGAVLTEDDLAEAGRCLERLAQSWERR